MIKEDGTESDRHRVTRITPKRIYYQATDTPEIERFYQVGAFNYHDFDFDLTVDRVNCLTDRAMFYKIKGYRTNQQTGVNEHA